MRYSIITTTLRGLYVGEVESHDHQSNVAVIKDCRHIAQWWCAVAGGLTSLAVHGPLPQSRIGSPCIRSTLTHVAHVHECSPRAIELFVGIEAHS